jgi:outer membrane assembly lipoprotein YfiO
MEKLMHMFIRMLAPIARRCGLMVFVVSMAVGGVAGGQEVFELSEQGFEKVQAPDPGTPEGELHAIRQAIAAGELKKAEELADAWIKARPNHPRLDEAFLLRGDAKSAQTEHYKALFDYEYLLRAFPASQFFDTALERELKIAEAFARGVKRKLWGMRIIPAEGEAEEIFIRIQERSPGSKVAERAGIELADHYYRQSDMSSAAIAYELFQQNYPQSQWREYAMQRQILSNLATFKGPRYDATGLIEAKNRIADYQQSYPAAAEQLGAEAFNARIDETLATRDLLVAQWYDKKDQRISAVVMYKRVIRDHPGSAAAARALDRLRELAPAEFASAPALSGSLPPVPTAAPDAPDAPGTPAPSVPPQSPSTDREPSAP